MRARIPAVPFLLFSLFALQQAHGAPQIDNPGFTDQEDCKADHGAVPKYLVVKKYRINLKPGLILFVSIDPADATRDKLIALVCGLGLGHAEEQDIFIYIFDSSRAANGFDPQDEGNERRTNPSYRAYYGFSRSAGPAYGQSLSWRTDRDPAHWVHIDLGPPPKPGK